MLQDMNQQVLVKEGHEISDHLGRLYHPCPAFASHSSGEPPVFGLFCLVVYLLHALSQGSHCQHWLHLTSGILSGIVAIHHLQELGAVEGQVQQLPRRIFKQSQVGQQPPRQELAMVSSRDKVLPTSRHRTGTFHLQRFCEVCQAVLGCLQKLET